MNTLKVSEINLKKHSTRLSKYIHSIKVNETDLKKKNQTGIFYIRRIKTDQERYVHYAI